MLRFMVVIVGVSFGPASLWSGEILLVTASSDTERIDALVRAIDSQGHQASLALSGLKVVPPQFDSDVFAAVNSADAVIFWSNLPFADHSLSACRSSANVDARRLLNDVRLPSVTLREDATDEQLDAAIDTLVGVIAGDGPAFPARTTGDFNQDGVWTAADIDALIDAISEPTPDLTFDIDESGELDLRDLDSLVQDVYLTWYGDANLNGGFGTDDLVLVFQVGKYESGRQATWSEGDWDGDRRFTSSDFVHAFRDTGYCPGPRPSVPEPGSVALLAPTIFLAIGLRRSLLRGMQSPGGSVPEPSSLTLLLIGLLAIRRRK